MARGKRKAEETEEHEGPYETSSPRYHANNVSSSVNTGLNATSTRDYVSQYSSRSIGRSTPSSSLLEALDAVSEPREKKKARKQEDLDSPAPEKRGAMFKNHCPKVILERVDRVMHQRFFLLERRRNGQELREEFDVLGSTGNVYTVSIDKRPSCTCPDASKGNHCKHILFIFLKVLQVPQRSTHWYQKALLSEELDEIFREAPAAPNALVNPQLSEAYARATGRSTQDPSNEGPKKDKVRRTFSEDDDCAVCYDTLHGHSAKNLSICDQCGNAVHNECFQRWSHSARQRPVVTCVYCRAPWIEGGNSTSTPQNVKISEGYVNLSGVAGVSPIRDTSSYYHGPRRGSRYYGCQEYNDAY